MFGSHTPSAALHPHTAPVRPRLSAGSATPRPPCPHARRGNPWSCEGQDGWNNGLAANCQQIGPARSPVATHGRHSEPLKARSQRCTQHSYRRNKHLPSSSGMAHPAYVRASKADTRHAPLFRLDDLLKRLGVHLCGGHNLLHFPEDYIEVLIVRLRNRRPKLGNMGALRSPRKLSGPGRAVDASLKHYV